MVTDYSSVKKTKLLFDSPQHETSYKDISEILNECSLFEIVNVHTEEHVERNGKTLNFVKAVLHDNTDTIPITIFGNLTKEVKVNQCYSIKNARISNYMSHRLLKQHYL